MGRRQGPEVQQVSGIQYMIFYGIKKVWDFVLDYFGTRVVTEIKHHAAQRNNDFKITLLVTGKHRGKYDSCPISSW